MYWKFKIQIIWQNSIKSVRKMTSLKTFEKYQEQIVILDETWLNFLG